MMIPALARLAFAGAMGAIVLPPAEVGRLAAAEGLPNVRRRREECSRHERDEVNSMAWILEYVFHSRIQFAGRI